MLIVSAYIIIINTNTYNIDIDQLEEDGIIGPATGNSKPREVLYQYDSTQEEE